MVVGRSVGRPPYDYRGRRQHASIWVTASLPVAPLTLPSPPRIETGGDGCEPCVSLLENGNNCDSTGKDRLEK